MRAVVLGLAMMIASTVADAACPAMQGADAALTAHDDEARLAWIQARLARTAHRSTIWLRFWEIALVGATTVDLALIPILGDTDSNRIDFGLGAATTIVGIVPLLFWQPRVLDDHDELDALVVKGAADRCVLVAEAERRLIADARAQGKQRAWYLHAGNVVLNTGVTFLFGAFHHWKSGVLNGVGGAIIGEAIIFTEPVDQLDDLETYRRGELGRPGDHTWQLVPFPTVHGTGLALAVTF